ncbi:hypothetical protein OG562_20270 [Streptomyces sp. NBC_01275]|uniref:hypothetical protein n=1 Tax=Streptomyces sp. NBC_01275 TaxID=2903807 RepID=UPI002252EAEC|nr:hypothetical protein [Streptomyces sp. NBC_01275]MCX4763262.1 hypothetical protein [Streptomyces sp. NBC_01275]
MNKTANRNMAKLPKYILRKYIPGETWPGEGAPGLSQFVGDEVFAGDMKQWFNRQPWSKMPPSALDAKTNGELAQQVLAVMMKHPGQLVGEFVITQDDTVLMRRMEGPCTATAVIGPLAV